MPSNTFSKDFRYVYANTVGIALTHSEVTLHLGIQLHPPTPEMEEQTAVIMNHTAAKLLVEMVGRLLKDFENATGQSIPVDPEKLAQIEHVIAEARALRDAAAPTAEAN